MNTIFNDRPSDLKNTNLDNIKIIGVAHVSTKSVEMVKEIIQSEKPDIVALELDEGRFNGLIHEEEISIKDNLKSKDFRFILTNTILASIQERIGKKLQTKPGEEMITAIDEANKIGASIALIDRDIKITLNSLLDSLSVKEKIKAFFSIIGSLFIRKKDLEIIDSITEEDTVDDLIREVEKTYPNVAKVLIDERNLYMAERLIELAKNNKDKKIVAVIGAGHEKGVKEYLQCIIEHDG